MNEVLGQRPSIAPPVPIAFNREDTPGQVPLWVTRRMRRRASQGTAGPRRKRRREDDLFELIKEDMRRQRRGVSRRENRGWRGFSLSWRE